MTVAFVVIAEGTTRIGLVTLGARTLAGCDDEGGGLVFRQGSISIRQTPIMDSIDSEAARRRIGQA